MHYLPYWQQDLRKMKKIKRKLLPKLFISQTLTFNISATECLIEIIFVVLDCVDQGLQHIPFYEGNPNFWPSQPGYLDRKWVYSAYSMQFELPCQQYKNIAHICVWLSLYWLILYSLLLFKSHFEACVYSGAWIYQHSINMTALITTQCKGDKVNKLSYLKELSPCAWCC